MGENNN